MGYLTEEELEVVGLLNELELFRAEGHLGRYALLSPTGSDIPEHRYWRLLMWRNPAARANTEADVTSYGTTLHNVLRQATNHLNNGGFR